MPLERERISVQTFCDEMGIDRSRFVGVEMERRSGPVILLLTKGDGVAQTSGTIPPLNQGGGKKPKPPRGPKK